MPTTVKEMSEIVQCFKANYASDINSYRLQLLGKPPLFVPGFSIQGWTADQQQPHLLEWPTTSYEESLAQYKSWSKKIGEPLPGLGRLIRVTFSLASCTLPMGKDHEIHDKGVDEDIRRVLSEGFFPRVHVACNSGSPAIRLDYK